MAKIDFPEGLNPLIPPLLPRRKEEEKKVSRGKGLFGTLLGQAVEKGGEGGGSLSLSEMPFSEADLELLLDEVHATGDRLMENPTVDLVQAYKKSVRDFVHYVVEHSYSLEQRTSRRKLDQRVYFRVAVIDDSLEKLAAEILRNQRDKLEILRRVEEINGMLVDLLR